MLGFWFYVPTKRFYLQKAFGLGWLWTCQRPLSFYWLELTMYKTPVAKCNWRRGAWLLLLMMNTASIVTGEMSFFTFFRIIWTLWMTNECVLFLALILILWHSNWHPLGSTDWCNYDPKYYLDLLLLRITKTVFFPDWFNNDTSFVGRYIYIYIDTRQSPILDINAKVPVLCDMIYCEYRYIPEILRVEIYRPGMIPYYFRRSL